MSDLIYSVAIEEFQKCEVKHMSLSILYMINHGLIDAQSLSREEDDGKLRISMGSDSDLNQGSLQKKDAQTFRNKEVGMSLNGGGLKRIRVAVVKTLLNKYETNVFKVTNNVFAF